MSLIGARTRLPELFGFIESLMHQINRRILTNWYDFELFARKFYTPDQMAKIEKYVPGWLRMASYADRATLIHITSALVSLMQLPEYQSTSRSGQQIMEWIVLFHDVGKQLPPEGGRDPAHAFRSAVFTAKGLQHNRFIQVGDNELDELCDLIQSAIKFDPQIGQEIQDNSHLGLIMNEIEHLFKHNAPEAFILKSVLLHMSIDVVADWPQVTPLDDTDLRKYLHQNLLFYLQVLMLVDNDAWALFDLEVRKRYREETLMSFERILNLIG